MGAQCTPLALFDIANLADGVRFFERKQTSLSFDLRLAASGAKRTFANLSMSAIAKAARDLIIGAADCGQSHPLRLGDHLVNNRG
jgi:hypothetical protein